MLGRFHAIAESSQRLPSIQGNQQSEREPETQQESDCWWPVSCGRQRASARPEPGPVPSAPILLAEATRGAAEAIQADTARPRTERATGSGEGKARSEPRLPHLWPSIQQGSHINGDGQEPAAVQQHDLTAAKLAKQ